MAREDLHFRLRIPEDLKKRIEVAADENRRSMTAEIVARLKWSFEFEERYGQGPGLMEHISLEKQNNELLSQFGEQTSELQALKWKADHPVEELRKTVEGQGRILGSVEIRMTQLENAVMLVLKALGDARKQSSDEANTLDSK
jgi:hypothetical protein